MQTPPGPRDLLTRVQILEEAMPTDASIGDINVRLTNLEKEQRSEARLADRDLDIQELDRRVTELHERIANLSSGGAQSGSFAPAAGGAWLVVASLLGIAIGLWLFFYVPPAHAGANSMQSSGWSLAWACENRGAFSERDRGLLGRLCGELGVW